MKMKRASRSLVALSVVSLLAIVGTGCSSNDSTSMDASDGLDELDPLVDEMLPGDEVTGDMAGEVSGSVALTCEEAAAAFVTLGMANEDLPEPMVSATCVDDSLVVTSNQIPDFPYIETSPGTPRAFDLEFTIPATPTVAETPTDVPALGALGVAVNGIPIFGATEGTGGDVLSLGSGFTECGGHNGPSGYHYHTFDVSGSDACRFTEAEATAGPVLFGYALDGYPIYSGNFQFRSSWFLSDETLFATDTFAAHSYMEGSGDLDQCNGRVDEDGNYAYYTTDTFPYTLGCYRGVVALEEPGGGPGPRQ